ncbi:MAG: hypothetical protein DHS20C03_37810 [Minwuia thermotolerans]|nr:MAG: hypothetical protein DHS20C03_37810 [Minwuia thermotolerans]
MQIKHGSLAVLLMALSIPAFGQDPIDVAALNQRAIDACPVVWEDIRTDIDPAAITGDVWQADTADRDAFKAFIVAELGGSAPDETGLNTMADDLPTVAAECATQRLGLLDGLINKLPNDALAAIAAVSEELQSGVSGLSLDGFLVGDIRMTGRSTPAEGWLFLVGQRIGAIGSGADVEDDDLEALFVLASGWPPNSGTEDFASGDTAVLPDLRGRVIAGLDSMGGTAANRLTDSAADQPGGSLGAESHQLTIDQMPSHSHGMGSAGNHSHTYTDVSTGGGSSIQTGSGKGDSAPTRTTSTSGNHSHSINSTGGGQAHPIVQPTALFNIEMKYR